MYVFASSLPPHLRNPSINLGHPCRFAVLGTCHIKDRGVREDWRKLAGGYYSMCCDGHEWEGGRYFEVSEVRESKGVLNGTKVHESPQEEGPSAAWGDGEVEILWRGVWKDGKGIAEEPGRVWWGIAGGWILEVCPWS